MNVRPPTGSSRGPRALLAAALLAAACGYEPKLPTFEWRVSAASAEALRAAEFSRPEVALERLGGALDLLFGSPSAPAYYVLDAWLDEERDPSDAWWELSDAAVDAVRADNEVRFAAQIRALTGAIVSDPGTARPLSVPAPRTAPDAYARFTSVFAPLLAGEVALGDLHPDSPGEDEASEDDPTFTWGDEALRHWVSHYPSLTESAELYRVRCLACHGSSGAGDGPTGRFLDPPPRDFRAGLFKWVGVEWNRRPRRADVLQVLRSGVEGTAMPSFRRLSRGELEGLVDWVRLLSLRGETELLSVHLASAAGDLRYDTALRAYGIAWERWDEAEEYAARVPDEVPRPAEIGPERIARGAELFRGSLANCASCHGAGGLGDGEAIWEETADGVRRRRPDAWGNPSAPRNLATGIFRGGDRPADLFRRIKYGIGGTIMPAADASLSDDDVWNLVYFVLSLSDGEGVAAAIEGAR